MGMAMNLFVIAGKTFIYRHAFRIADDNNDDNNDDNDDISTMAPDNNDDNDDNDVNESDNDDFSVNWG